MKSAVQEFSSFALFATFAVKGLFDLPIGRDETEPALMDALLAMSLRVNPSLAERDEVSALIYVS